MLGRNFLVFKTNLGVRFGIVGGICRMVDKRIRVALDREICGARSSIGRRVHMRAARQKQKQNQLFHIIFF